jgi:hypothetical protein
MMGLSLSRSIFNRRYRIYTSTTSSHGLDCGTSIKRSCEQFVDAQPAFYTNSNLAIASLLPGSAFCGGEEDDGGVNFNQAVTGRLLSLDWLMISQKSFHGIFFSAWETGQQVEN